MLLKSYLATSILFVGMYAYSVFTGWEFGSPSRERLEQSKAGAGYRSYTYWHTSSHFRGK